MKQIPLRIVEGNVVGTHPPQRRQKRCQLLGVTVGIRATHLAYQLDGNTVRCLDLFVDGSARRQKIDPEQDDDKSRHHRNDDDIDTQSQTHELSFVACNAGHAKRSSNTIARASCQACNMAGW